MKKSIIFYICGAVLAAIGVVIVLSTLAATGWEVPKMATTPHTYTVQGAYTSIEIDIDAGSLKTQFYDGDKIVIDCNSNRANKISITETQTALKFESKRKWYLNFGINFTDYGETILKLPKTIAYDLNIDVSAGKVYLESGTYGTLDIDVNAGNFSGDEIVCQSFKGKVRAGNLTVNGLTTNSADCSVSAGNLKLTSLTCNSVKADVSAGKLILDILGAKSEYTINCDASAGRCNVANQVGTTDKILDLDCSAGDIEVTFSAE